MCPLLSGPALQRIQLLFPPCACNLPAFHRGLTSSSATAPVGIFFLLLLTNISQRHGLHHPADQLLLLSSTHSRSSRDIVHGVPATFSLQEFQFSSPQWEQRWFSSELWGNVMFLTAVTKHCESASTVATATEDYGYWSHKCFHIN